MSPQDLCWSCYKKGEDCSCKDIPIKMDFSNLEVRVAAYIISENSKNNINITNTVRGRPINNMATAMEAMYGMGPIENYLIQIEKNIRIEQLYSKLGVIIFNKDKTHYPCGDFTDPVDYMTTEETVHMCKQCTEKVICGIVKEIKNILEISIDNTK